MSRRKMNTIFLLVIMVLITSFSVGYSALSQNLMISGDVSYYYNSNILYDVLKNEVNRNTGYAKEYTGTHQDSMSGVGSKKIYHWYGSDNDAGTTIQNKNNVIFANHCWQIIRTTDTGGVKLIYNGEVENNQCLNTRGNHVGYAGEGTQNLNKSYYYGTSYTYDKTNNVFSLSGTVTTGTIQTGQYTCKQTTSTGTCSTLYLIEDLAYGNTYYYVISLKGNSHYSQLGELDFNKSASSPAYLGYMYNSVYEVSGEYHVYFIRTSSWTINTSYYYSNTIDYNTTITNEYTLTNPIQISTLTDYNTLLGKYVLDKSGTHSTTVRYIISVDSNKVYYKEFRDGYLNTSASLTVGDSYTKSGNTYILTNPTNITYIDWYNNTNDYSIYKDKFFCDGNNTSCTTIGHIYNGILDLYSPSNYSFPYFGSNKTYSYAENITYSGGTYTLTGDIKTFWDLYNATNHAYLSTHHYTCLENGTSCSAVYYVTQMDPNQQDLKYAKLSGVSNVSTAINNMLNISTVNQKNSTVKNGIDAWYKKYMTSYTSKLEDTIFCNNRNITDLGVWNPNGGSVSSNASYLKFTTASSDLSCTNTTDKFSVANTSAKLTYPIGLLTASEAYLLNNQNILKTGKNYNLITPIVFNGSQASIYIINTSGGLASKVIYDYGVRPVISLKSGTVFTSGNGSMTSPYIVE